MNRRRNPIRRKRNMLLAISLPDVIAALSVAIGIACGYFISLLISDDSIQQLSLLITEYAASDKDTDTLSFVSLFFCYLRAPMFILLFGFSALGVIALPLLCVFEGFLLSFALCSFSLSLGSKHLLLLLGMFLPRMVLYLPVVLLLSAISWERSRNLWGLAYGGRHTAMYNGASYGYRFTIAMVVLCLCSAFECYLLPRLLRAGLF